MTKRRAKALSEVQDPFEENIAILRQRLERVLHEAQEKRYSLSSCSLFSRADQQDALMKMAKIVEELKHLNDEYVQKHTALEVLHLSVRLIAVKAPKICQSLAAELIAFLFE